MDKEMIKTLIEYGWKWVACDADGRKSVYIKKPHLNYRKDAFKPDCSTFTTIPSCFFKEITFENSPVELKTLLEDGVEEKVHRIKIGEFLKTIKKSVKVEITDQYGIKTKGWAVDLIKSGYYVYENIDWFDTEDGGIRVFLEGFNHPRTHLQILEENGVEE